MKEGKKQQGQPSVESFEDFDEAILEAIKGVRLRHPDTAQALAINVKYFEQLLSKIDKLGGLLVMMQPSLPESLRAAMGLHLDRRAHAALRGAAEFLYAQRNLYWTVLLDEIERELEDVRDIDGHPFLIRPLKSQTPMSSGAELVQGLECVKRWRKRSEVQFADLNDDKRALFLEQASFVVGHVLETLDPRNEAPAGDGV